MFSKYIRARDRVCVTCGSIGDLQCGHLFSRASYATRWDPKNAFAQCPACNLRHEYDPGPLTLYFLNKYGRKEYEKLHKKFRSHVKITNGDLLDVVQKYKNLLQEMEAENEQTRL